ncbi:cation transporter [Asticcacaulis excentricus]|uniref:Cation efflux protein n=1 Tax=Asticcacaulis excentricus (strain ATCC 15261 / DSM 4724 / KCTC 12464 / NCIMB 9791 / VKM B-1370 / CB 48) TaxID=573065 RepID=E8RTK9_ASTEC|nr:cation transporter [Asticcacaulis excentricus]ADU14830.1 cation efflux protein [Asticcacaulis excentricus CB 48]
MSAHSHHHDHDHSPYDHRGHSHHIGPATDPAYRRALWWVMAVNAAMFFVEIGAGLQSQSKALLADSLDFAGDAANIALSLFVLTAAVKVRARASLLKAASMFGFALWIMGTTLWQVYTGTVPRAEVMGLISLLAVASNVGSALLLWKYREGDSNMMSVWLCTRNDAIGNLMVLGAAVGVYFTRNTLPDAIVALIMVAMGLQAATRITQHALTELKV